MLRFKNQIIFIVYTLLIRPGGQQIILESIEISGTLILNELNLAVSSVLMESLELRAFVIENFSYSVSFNVNFCRAETLL